MLARLNSASHVIMTCERNVQGSVHRLIRQMEQKNDKITTVEIKNRGAPRPEDKQPSSIALSAIQLADDKNESSDFGRKLTIVKQTVNTVGSLGMASEFCAEAVTSDDNEEEDGKLEISNNRKFAIDKIASGDSDEADLKTSNAEELAIGLQLNEGRSRTFVLTHSEGQISKARRPALLPLRSESYLRPAFHVMPDDVVGNATNAVPDRVVNPFELPVRFRKRIETSTSGSDVETPISVVDYVYLEDKEKEEEVETRRHADMEMALAWIQHELASIKIIK